MITLIAVAQSELEWPKYLSHSPPLDVDGSIGFKSMFRKSRKVCSLLSNTWKDIF